MSKNPRLLTPLIIELLQDFCNDLSYGLNGFDVIFSLLKFLLKVLQGEAYFAEHQLLHVNNHSLEQRTIL